MKTKILKTILFSFLPVFLLLSDNVAKADTGFMVCQGSQPWEYGASYISFGVDKSVYNIGDTIVGSIYEELGDIYHPGCLGAVQSSNITGAGDISFGSTADPLVWDILGGTVGGNSELTAYATFGYYGESTIALSTSFGILNASQACGICSAQAYYPFGGTWTWPYTIATSTCIAYSTTTPCTPQIPMFGEAIGSPVLEPNSVCGFPDLQSCSATNLNQNPIVNVR